ncbi:hypothetical protein LIER_17177 [Lithospermum erythrorhizon]|uniref:Uncharacterized protein n=1 Tax=Lithospermum erythrorhizon TaxID=34254 RepID=A0AAV3QES4_LITER
MTCLLQGLCRASSGSTLAEDSCIIRTQTTVLLGYEIRSTNVHQKILDWKCHFDVNTVPRAKLYILSPKTDYGAQNSRVELHLHTEETYGALAARLLRDVTIT